MLLIRLSLQTLTEALRKLWPHLLNELISVFEARTNENGINDRENTDLIIEAIKLVELLASLNIEDFQMNQWIFLIDGYGMKEIQKDDQVKNKQDKPGTENARQHPTKDNKDHETEAFKTFIIRFIGGQEFSFYNVDKPHDGYGERDYGALNHDDPQDNDIALELEQEFNGSDEDDIAPRQERGKSKPELALPSAPPRAPPLVGTKSGKLAMQDQEQTEEGMLIWHALALQ